MVIIFACLRRDTVKINELVFIKEDTQIPLL